MLPRPPIFLAATLLAAALPLLAAPPALAQIFQQGPMETRAYRNPSLAPPADTHGHQHGIETENMFGFTLGSDTDEAGSFGVASENVLRLDRRGGRYAAFGTKLEFAYGLADNLSISGSLLGGYRAIRAVDDLPDTNRLRFDGIGGEIRWRILQRGPSPVGVTLHLEPAFRTSDEVSGEGGHGFSSENKLILDTALVPDKIFAAMNIIYDVEAFRPHGADSTERASTIGISGAVSTQVSPGLFLGGELRYLRAYEGMGLNRFHGEALFAGPNLFWHAGESAWISLGYVTQVSGRAAGARPGLDLTNFDRHAIRLKIGVHF